jgi:hypothetical protein
MAPFMDTLVPFMDTLVPFMDTLVPFFAAPFSRHLPTGLAPCLP